MANRQPPNSEILKAVKEVKDMQAAQAREIKVLTDWKQHEDAYRAALKQVKDEEAQEKTTGQKDSDFQKRTEIMKQVGIVLALIIALLSAYGIAHGVRVP